MKFRWFTTRAAFFLLILAIYPSSAVPPQRHLLDSEGPSRLRLAQAIAVSDFDSDGLIDEAKLNAFGSHKSVGIFLSGTRKLSFIDFESRSLGHGSLLSQDVDNDGEPDLIWTDLFRADSVIVWLGDGTGDFERLTGSQHSGRFILGEANVASPPNTNPEPDINVESNSPLDHTPIPILTDRRSTAIANGHSYRLGSLSTALDQPADRGPPALLL